MAVINDLSSNTILWGQIPSNTEIVNDVEFTQAALNQEQDIAVSNAPSGNIFDDPLGDTFGFGETRLDIESVSSTLRDDNLNLRVDFFTPIAPPSSFLPQSVVGYIDLDIDQNSATGITSFQSIFAPPEQQGGSLGDEAFIDLFSESSNPGFVNLINTTNFTTIGQLPISYGSDFLEIQLPLELFPELEGVNFGTVIGTSSEPTDAAPNTQFASVTLPPPPPLIGTENDDVLTGSNRGNFISGLGGNDILQGLGGNDQIFGDNDNDLITGGNGNDIVEGGSGNDVISGNSGDDTLSGQEGQDDIQGGDGNDRIFGGNDSDRLLGEAGNDTIDGEDGNDTIDGGNDNDTISGGDGNDRVFGGSGVDSLSGGAGADTLTGGLGNDNLDGGDGDDRLIGVDANVAGSGVGFGAGELDTFTGLSGRDTFVLADSTGVYYSDGDPLTPGELDYALITDFNSSEDVIQLYQTADFYSLDFFTSTTGTIDAALIYDPGITDRGEVIGILQNVLPDLNLTSTAFSFV